MQWSKLRSKLRGFICSPLQKRIDFHVTSYRQSHDEAEKAWITVDGHPVLTCSWYRHQWHGWPRDTKGRLDWNGPISGPLNQEEAGVFLPQHLGQSLRDYLDMPIQDALRSPDPFIRALSVVDRRIGRRTLETLRIDDTELPFVRAFYELRMAVNEQA